MNAPCGTLITGPDAHHKSDDLFQSMSAKSFVWEQIRKSKQKERSHIPETGLTHSITMFTHNFTSTMAKGKDRHFSKDEQHKSYIERTHYYWSLAITNQVCNEIDTPSKPPRGYSNYHEPAVAFSTSYLKEPETSLKNIYTEEFTGFTLAKTQPQLQCPSVDEWINTIWSSHMMEFSMK